MRTLTLSLCWHGARTSLQQSTVRLCVGYSNGNTSFSFPCWCLLASPGSCSAGCTAVGPICHSEPRSLRKEPCWCITFGSLGLHSGFYIQQWLWSGYSQVNLSLGHCWVLFSSSTIMERRSTTHQRTLSMLRWENLLPYAFSQIHCTLCPSPTRSMCGA